MSSKKTAPKQPADAEQSADQPEYIAFPGAWELLKRQISDVTKLEVAAWLAYATTKDGKVTGGLAAYKRGTYCPDPKSGMKTRYERVPSGCFFMSSDENLTGHLTGYYYIKGDIESFSPKERFITGSALIDRWSSHFSNSNELESFILAHNANSELDDCRLSLGGLGNGGLKIPADKLNHLTKLPQSIGASLFALSQVTAIEIDVLKGLASSEDQGLTESPTVGDVMAGSATQKQCSSNPVSKRKIIDTFPRPKGVKNFEAWLGRPPKAIASARQSNGSRGISAKWDPYIFAENAVNGGWLTIMQINTVMKKHFPALMGEWENLHPNYED